MNNAAGRPMKQCLKTTHAHRCGSDVDRCVNDVYKCVNDVHMCGNDVRRCVCDIHSCVLVMCSFLVFLFICLYIFNNRTCCYI